ncbi:lytic transglycosylase domain-containing protein [Chelatococcus reniformis]|nr:transglycosylase SLT domain-containing protein [Chelatococcus reniformis]
MAQTKTPDRVSPAVGAGPSATAGARAGPASGEGGSAKPDAEAREGAAPKPAVVRPVTSADRAGLRIKVRTQALKLGLPPQIADAVAEVESGYNSSAIGGAGEVGLMQVLPSTARMMGFSGTEADLAQPENSVRYGVTYLARAWQLASRDICTTVMKYRAGHGETRFSVRSVDYCRRVRAVLTSQGYPVTGELPEATFGEPAAAGAQVFPGPRGKARSVVQARTKGGRSVAAGRRRSRIDWAAADQRMRAITSKVSAATLLIAR